MQSQELAALEKENKSLKRRLERLEKEMKNLSSMYDRALSLRDFSEKEKQLQHEYNTLLLENAPDMILFLDQELRFRLGSRGVIDFLGKGDATRLQGMRFADLFKGVMQDSWIEPTQKIYERVLKEGTPVSYNDEVSLGGERVVYAVSIAPATDSLGNRIGVICLVHDTTELVRMKEAAEAATVAKSAFLASMSHEIRTPMNAIKGFSDLMMQTPLTGQQKNYVTNIIHATSGLLLIINDILDFSKIEANRYEIVEEDYDIAREIEDLCHIMQPKAEEVGLYFCAEIDPVLPSALKADRLRIRQVLMNIINNAIKFTPDGGIVFSVTGIPVSDNEWTIRYGVKDTGLGIKQEELEKIFQAFGQADSYKNRNISGTGLGLAISKNLVELMGGEITVHSEYGVGSLFSVSLPQQVSDAVPIAFVESKEKNVLFFSKNSAVVGVVGRSLKQLGVAYKTVLTEESVWRELQNAPYQYVLVDNQLPLAENIVREYAQTRVACVLSVSDFSTAETYDSVVLLFRPLLVSTLALFLNDKDCWDTRTGTEPQKLGSARFDRARVLIVDDNETNLIVASEIMKTYGIHAQMVNSGEKAIQSVTENEYDLVFMDHMMPEMDGVEATLQIRKLPIPQPPIVALTANAILGMEQVYKENGFNGYLTKPIVMESLNAVLHKWLVPSESEVAPLKSEAPFEKDSSDGVQIQGVDVPSGIMMTGGTLDNYLRTLVVFYADGTEKIALLSECVASANRELFVIHVHALKSALACIGAQELSETAARLESAGREGDSLYLSRKAPAFIAGFESLLSAIQEVIPQQEETAPQADADPQLICSLLQSLKSALNEMDVSHSDFLLAELKNALPQIAHKKWFENIAQSILLCDFEDAVALVEQLSQAYSS